MKQPLGVEDDPGCKTLQYVTAKVVSPTAAEGRDHIRSRPASALISGPTPHSRGAPRQSHRQYHLLDSTTRQDRTALPDSSRCPITFRPSDSLTRMSPMSMCKRAFLHGRWMGFSGRSVPSIRLSPDMTRRPRRYSTDDAALRLGAERTQSPVFVPGSDEAMDLIL